MLGTTKLKLALAALAIVMLGLAPSVRATEVVPAGEPIEAASIGPVGFLPANAESPLYVACEGSALSWTVPAAGGNANNVNQLGVGEFSTGAGSVIMDEPAPPEYAGCALFLGEEALAPAEVIAAGNWTLVGAGLNAATGIAQFGVPVGGLEIEIPATGCTVNFAPMQFNPLFATVLNEPNALIVDSQIVSLVEGCPPAFESPWQIEGAYEFNNGFAVFP